MCHFLIKWVHPPNPTRKGRDRLLPAEEEKTAEQQTHRHLAWEMGKGERRGGKANTVVNHKLKQQPPYVNAPTASVIGRTFKYVFPDLQEHLEF